MCRLRLSTSMLSPSGCTDRSRRTDRVRLVALVEGPNHVCCRYRLAAFRPRLEAAGHTLELRPFPRSFWGRLRLGAGADLMIVQRRLLPGWQLALLRRRVRRLVFDLDDAVFLRDSYSPRGLHDPRRLRRFAAVVGAADAVVAGNAFLAAEAQRHADRPVVVIPTCVDPGRYPLAGHERKQAAELVWIGSSSTLQGLEAVAPLLEEV